MIHLRQRSGPARKFCRCRFYSHPGRFLVHREFVKPILSPEHSARGWNKYRCSGLKVVGIVQRDTLSVKERLQETNFPVKPGYRYPLQHLSMWRMNRLHNTLECGNLPLGYMIRAEKSCNLWNHGYPETNQQDMANTPSSLSD